MKAFILRFIFVPLTLGASIFPSRADTHIYAGASVTNQNDKLNFSNAAVFDANQSNISLPQILRTNGFNTGHYRGDSVTFSALAGTLPNGGPVAGHAALGARLAVQVVSVMGPAGGSFAFWEGDGESDLGVITFSVPVGTTNGTNYLVISENNGEPGADPYGHIHGREFTSSAAGNYIVGFRLIDLSTNGLQGGPIHFASDILPVRFQAGLRIESIQTVTNRVTLSFRSPPGISNVLEATESLVSANWQPVGAPLRGNNNLQFLIETNAAGTYRFYRLHQINNLP